MVLYFLYATFLALLPIAALPFLYGAEAAFFLLTGDAYLYLGIAEESGGSFYTFDGERPTNGFHPVWQGYVWALRHGLGLKDMALMNVTAWSCVALTLAGLWILGPAVRRGSGSWSLAILAVPGIYFLLVGQGTVKNLTLWDMFNGMEAALSFLQGCLLAVLLVRLPEDGRAPMRWLILTGLLLAFVFLTRLDNAFAVACVSFAVLLWPGRPIFARLRDATILAIPAIVALGFYLGYNYREMGVLMPVSGAAKGDLALIQNGWVSVVNLFGPVFDLRGELTAYEGDRAMLAKVSWRVRQLFYIGFFAAVLGLFALTTFRARSWAPYAAGICAGIVIKALYNFVNVSLWHQASWYFGFELAFMAFLSALMLAGPIHALAREGRVALWAPVLVCATVSLFYASSLYHAVFGDHRALTYRAFYHAAPAIETRIRAAVPDPKVLEFGDGFVNFTLDLPTRHGFVFAGDTYSLAALEQGALLRASAEDGYNVLASFEYLGLPERTEGWGSDALRDFLRGVGAMSAVRHELDDFDFELIEVYEENRAPFIAFRLKEAG